jgi:MFS family permease
VPGPAAVAHRRSDLRNAEVDEMFKLWERWGAALGVVAVVVWAIAFAFGNDSPESGDSDTTISAWLASNSHQNRQIIGFFAFLAGTLCAIGFFAALRERLADRGHPEMGALAFGAGVASSVLSIIAITMFTAPSFLAADTRPSDVPPSTFRILNDMGYQCWVAGAVIGAIVVWATSAVALRTGLLPRWFGWLGILVGVVQLFAIFFFPILLFWLWILVAGALLTWRRADVTPPPAGTMP